MLFISFFTYSITAEDAGKKAGDYLAKKQGYSVRLLRKLKQCPNGVTRNGVPLRMIDRLKEGDLLEVTLPLQEDGRLSDSKRRVPIVYEDESVIVYHKPSLLATHPSRGHQEDTLANVFCRDMRERGEEHPVFRPVYRLDRDTDGLCLIAKNTLAAALLAGKTEKIYTALVQGALREECGVIDAPIVQLALHYMQRGVREDGQRSVTHYRVLERGRLHTLVECRLETGRTHQIRVHFAYIGHPLAGDCMYGGDTDRFSTQTLRCTQLRFASPDTGEIVKLCINIPTEWIKVIHSE